MTDGLCAVGSTNSCLLEARAKSPLSELERADALASQILRIKEPKAIVWRKKGVYASNDNVTVGVLTASEYVDRSY